MKEVNLTKLYIVWFQVHRAFKSFLSQAPRGPKPEDTDLRLCSPLQVLLTTTDILNTQTLFDQLSNITQTQCLCINEKKIISHFYEDTQKARNIYSFSVKNMSVNCFQGNLIYYINNHPWIPLLYKSKLWNFIWKPPKVKERTQKLTTLTQRMNSSEKFLTHRM